MHDRLETLKTTAPPTPMSAGDAVRFEIVCVNDIGICIRMLNSFAVVRAGLCALHCACRDGEMTLTIDVVGLTTVQGEHLSVRLARIEGVHGASVLEASNEDRSAVLAVDHV